MPLSLNVIVFYQYFDTFNLKFLLSLFFNNLSIELKFRRYGKIYKCINMYQFSEISCVYVKRSAIQWFKYAFLKLRYFLLSSLSWLEIHSNNYFLDNVRKASKITKTDYCQWDNNVMITIDQELRSSENKDVNKPEPNKLVCQVASI